MLALAAYNPAVGAAGKHLAAHNPAVGVAVVADDIPAVAVVRQNPMGVVGVAAVITVPGKELAVTAESAAFADLPAAEVQSFDFGYP